MSYNILVVGAGQLGSRHLQSMALLPEGFKVHVLDHSKDSLELAEQRYKSVSSNTSPDLDYHTSLSAIKGLHFDVTVVATNSANRLQVLEQLVENVSLEHLILEKVLFQSTEQLKAAEQLLKQNKINAWVNCPRRIFTAYKDIKQRYESSHSVEVTVSGYNWGLACNAIHFIDLWQFFAQFESYSLAFKDIAVISSKRSGYQELTGVIEGVSDCGKHKLKLSCFSTDDKVVSSKLVVSFDDQAIVFGESEAILRWLDHAGKVIKETTFDIPYQSESTQLHVLALLESGVCELTPFDTSSMLHEEFLNKALAAFNESSDTTLQNKIVPIT